MSKHHNEQTCQGKAPAHEEKGAMRDCPPVLCVPLTVVWLVGEQLVGEHLPFEHLISNSA